jgi:hypothetical protein
VTAGHADRAPGTPAQPGSADRAGELIVENEFGRTALSLERRGRSTSLRITDVRSGRVGHLDALELECIAWASHGDLVSLLDPSRTRWQADERDVR